MNECESDMKDAWPEILEMVCLKREGEKRSQRGARRVKGRREIVSRIFDREALAQQTRNSMENEKGKFEGLAKFHGVLIGLDRPLIRSISRI